jgi:hypothetical protein
VSSYCLFLKRYYHIGKTYMLYFYKCCVILLNIDSNPPIHAFSCSHAYNKILDIKYVIVKKQIYLSIEGTFIVWLTKLIIFNSNKIRCRSIQRCWIAILSTKIICCAMIDVMI